MSVDTSKLHTAEAETSTRPYVKTSGEKSHAIDHTAIRASAGSGKTFQLINRYLQLIDAGAEPATILASTFTRQAAGQIRDKIFTDLAAAVEEPGQRLQLARRLGIDSIARPSVIDLLARLARRMHLLQIRTLDSFFASVVKSFAIELGVPIGADVVDENQARALRSRAIQLMLDESRPQELVEMLRLLTQGSSESGVTDAIDEVVADLYALYREAPAEAWDCLPQMDGRLKHTKLVDAINRLQETACTGDKRFVKAHSKDCENARAWDWPKFLKGGMAKAVANGSNIYHSKPIAPELVDAYKPVVQHAIAELVGRAREQSLAARELLALFHRQFDKLKRAQTPPALTFDDLTAAMAGAQQLGTLDDIGFRLDARVQHLLLDEFQDTSIPQWRALEPLVREIISFRPPERSFFCVGDVKQSIYGWRDAAPEVLEDLPNLLTGADGASAITPRELACSYRSSPIIMDVVNQVFESLVEPIPNAAVVDCLEAAQSWRSGFIHHETAKTDYPGYAELRYCRAVNKNDEGEKEEVKDVRLRAAAKLAADLHRRNPNIRIALLTRSNNTVARLLYELGPSRLKLQVSARGGGPLIDAAPVNAILDLLQLADHPDDTAAAFHVAATPLGAVVGLPDFRDAKQRRRVARQLRRTLLIEGYGRTIAEWVRALTNPSTVDARELRRLHQLVELAQAHDQPSASSMRTRDFIAVVEQTNVADVQPAPIQVMTIHQAKGLEFDAVILADLDGRTNWLVGANPPVVFERQGDSGPITRICRQLPAELQPFVPELQGLFDRHKRRAARESLSLLYVAMTRARHALYVVIDPPKLKKDGGASQEGLKTLAGVLRCGLADGALEPDRVPFQIGDAEWMMKLPKLFSRDPRPPQPTNQAPGTVALAPAPAAEAALQRGWSAAAASHSHAPPCSSIKFELRIPDAQARARGLAIHALFEQIEWLEDFQLDETKLLRIVRTRVPRPSDQDEKWARTQVANFQCMLKQPQIKQALSRPRPLAASRAEPQFILRREHPFARLIDGRLQTGAIDRLIIESTSDRKPCGATILDFKTDAIDAAQAQSCAARYAAQLQTYRDVVAQQTGLPANLIAARLLFVEPGLVIESGACLAAPPPSC